MDSGDNERTAMIVSLDPTDEDDIASSTIVTPFKVYHQWLWGIMTSHMVDQVVDFIVWVVTCCTPTLFFTIAGLLLLFLVGSNLFMFVSANTGNAPAMEITAESEDSVVRDESSGPASGRRAREPPGEEAIRETAVTKARAPQANVVRGGNPNLLPGRSLLCVLGGWSKAYALMRLDGLCDVVFVPFYALPQGGDTLLDDGHRITQNVLEVAAKSIKTTYGIHVPLNKASQVTNDLQLKRAQKKMKIYWMKNKIYHYALLDLQVGTNGSTASDVVDRVFHLLATFRDAQNKIRRAVSAVASRRPHAAYVVLGARPRLETNEHLFRALEKRARSFVVSAFIIRTHIRGTETLTAHDGCKTIGPAPYKIKNDKHIMGMAGAVSYSRKFSWVKNTTLVVSFTLCMRRYRAKKELHIGAECLKDAKGRTARILSSAALCRKNPGFYEDQAVDKVQRTAYSWRKPDVVATYDTADTMRWKICHLERTHRRLNLSVALFDAECEDWRGKCSGSSLSHMTGPARIRSMSAYLRRLSHLEGNANRTCS